MLVAPGTCAEKPVSEYQILPYLGSYEKKLATRSVVNKRGTFIVVANGKTVGSYKSLYAARNMLNSFKVGPRCIFEVKNGTVLSDPHTIAGYSQSPKFGFHKSWADWYDIRRMHRIGLLWYAFQNSRISNVKGSFIVVVGNRVVDRYDYLFDARRALRHHKKVSRCIFEVRGDVVQRDPHTIGGVEQSPANGFDRYWNNWDDIYRMRRIAMAWYLIRVRIRRTEGSFIVMAKLRVVGKYRKLSVAQNVLRRIRSEPRAIFQVLDGKVCNPRVIAGIKQLPENSFDVRWNGWVDINRMRRAATFWYADHFKNVRNVRGIFVVVDGDEVVGRYSRLRLAFLALRRHKKRSHCVFEVKNGIVLHNPRTIAGYKQSPEFGFDRYWMNRNDIHRMHHIARIWYIRMYKLGSYIVVANKRVVGSFSRLFHAQRALQRFQNGQRCIFEVKKNKVVWNPHVIGGIMQTPRNHFNVQWGNFRSLLRIALLWNADRTGKLRNVVGTFIVVHKNVARKYNRLHLAMLALRRPSKMSRCIFEVKNDVVLRNPRKIAGYAQLPVNGFDRYWRNWSDISKMHQIAEKWWDAHHIVRVDDKKGEFLVVVKDVLIGRYTSLRFAQQVLSYYKHGRRAMFEVRNGQVQSDAHKIAGYSQTKKYGFNKMWKNSNQLRDMSKVAIEWYHARWASQYVIVHGAKVLGPYYKILSARQKLRGYQNKSHVRRAIFIVDKGIVKRYPITAPGQYWQRSKDIKAMYGAAIRFFNERWSKYNAKVALVANSVITKP